MRVRIIAIVIALLAVCGQCIENGSSASLVPQQERPRVVISKEGVLIDVLDADGKSLMGKILGEGLELNYKTKDAMRSASTREAASTELLTSPGPPDLNGNKARAIRHTTDKALEITSIVTFDDKSGALIIKRKVRNVSKYPVILNRMTYHVDPGVMVRDQVYKRADQSLVSLDQIIAAIWTGDCSPIDECPMDPPRCRKPPCPAPNPNPSPLFERGALDVLTQDVALRWSKPIILQPWIDERSKSEVSMVIHIIIPDSQTISRAN